MKRAGVISLFCAGLLLLLAGCLATPVERTGGPGSITIFNTNPQAVFRTATSVFAAYGYTPGRRNSPTSFSFERPAGRLGELAFGSHMQTTTFRVNVQLVQIPGTNNIRLMASVARVNNANVAGFESSTQMMRVWSGQFKPILRKIQAGSENAGPWK